MNRILGIVGIGALGALLLTWTQVSVPTFSETRTRFQPSDRWIVDQSGTPMESIRVGKQERSLEWIEWKDVSPAFKELLIVSEDQRFFTHHGVDPLAVAKSLWERVRGVSQRGASTLTMQLTGLLARESGRRTILEKMSQVIRALKLERSWTKEQIVEAYVNLVSFRGELVGLRAASHGFFHKAPSGLLRDESALLVALIRSPNAASQLVAKRACAMLSLSDCSGSEIQAQQIFDKPYQLARTRQWVPVLAESFVRSDAQSSVIQTTLDHRIQERAMQLLRDQLSLLKSQNVNDGAVLVLETQTGRIVAYAANAGADHASQAQVDGIRAKRQAGSTLKPFVYATAIDMNLMDEHSLILDSPATIHIKGGQVYNPKNYDLTFRGLVRASDALASSMNVPAVKTLKMVGESHVLERMRGLGFENLFYDDYYGPSLALGAVDVSLFELTEAYRRLEVSSDVYSEQTKKTIFKMLSKPEHRRFTFGSENILNLPFPAAVKTGTSKDMRDNWCIGWTKEFTVGVWIGNFNGQPMWDVSGTSGAAPIWNQVMLALHPHAKSPLAKSDPIEPSEKKLVQPTLSHIRYPAESMLIGFDPDIPKRFQKLPIEIENPQKDHTVFVNQKRMGRARETLLWPIQKGKYKVELRAKNGHLVDSVPFEVR